MARLETKTKPGLKTERKKILKNIFEGSYGTAGGRVSRLTD